MLTGKEKLVYGAPNDGFPYSKYVLCRVFQCVSVVDKSLSNYMNAYGNELYIT